MTLPKKNLKIAGLGEVLWDIQNGEKNLGGAPANFACHCANLGASSYMVSSVGNDELGHQSLHFLEQMHVNVQTIESTPDYLTGVVNVTLDTNGVPEYDIKQQVAWDYISYTPQTAEVLKRLDAICFGTLALRSEVSQKTIIRYLEELPESCLKVFDVNIRQNFYTSEIILVLLKKADVLKLNDEELPLLAKILSLTGDQISQIKHIQKQFNLKLIILTLGAEGSMMLTPHELSKFHPKNTIEVKSTVGAGDAFTAATTVGFLLGRPLREINSHANKVAAYVCTQSGAVPVLPSHLKFVNP